MLARFYKEELDYLRGMAREFADAHPGVVANALLTPGADPRRARNVELKTSASCSSWLRG